MAINLFGFELIRKKTSEQLQPQISAPISDDGAINITSGGYFGTYLDLEASFKTEADLVTRYREMSMQPELDAAIDDIVNESIVHDVSGKSVSITVISLPYIYHSSKFKAVSLAPEPDAISLLTTIPK